MDPYGQEGSHAFEAFRRSESRFCRRSRSAAVPGGTPFPFRCRSRSLPFQPRAFSAVPFSLPFHCSAAVPVPLLPPFPFCRRSRSPPFPFRAIPFRSLFLPFRREHRSRSRRSRRSAPFPVPVPVPVRVPGRSRSAPFPFRSNPRSGNNDPVPLPRCSVSALFPFRLCSDKLAGTALRG